MVVFQNLMRPNGIDLRSKFRKVLLAYEFSDEELEMIKAEPAATLQPMLFSRNRGLF